MSDNITNAEWLKRSADLLLAFAEGVRHVKPDQIELFPYLPEADEAAEQLTAIAALQAERDEMAARISILEGVMERIQHDKSYYASNLARMALGKDHEPQKHSYHDLHITTSDIPRTSIFNLPYDLQVTCSRVTGWHLERIWMKNGGLQGEVIAGEYDDFLRLDVDGYIIVDSTPPTTEGGEQS